jgi:F-type H+-transporting ATPase subunit delta
MDAPYASRYARALLDVLEKPGRAADPGAEHRMGVEKAQAELGDFAAAWDESPALRDVFVDPSITAAKKIEILDRLNQRLEMSKPVRNFLAVILNHERMEGFPEILSSFQAMVRGDLHVAKVEWITARPLSEDARRAVEVKIAEMTGKRVEATFRDDPAVLGGARLQIGSVVYDGTVRARLDGLKEKLAGQV